MMKRVITLLCIALIAASCGKKQVKPEEKGPSDNSGAAVQDSAIVNKDLSFDPQGSDSGNIDGLHTIHFDYDKASLSAEARELLAKNYDWMKKHGGSTIQIEGHCDQKGSIEYNLALGERRAKAVRQYLTELGADKSRISIISYGKEKPLDTAGTDPAEAKNRRANFVIISK